MKHHMFLSEAISKGVCEGGRSPVCHPPRLTPIGCGAARHRPPAGLSLLSGKMVSAPSCISAEAPSGAAPKWRHGRAAPVLPDTDRSRTAPKGGSVAPGTSTGGDGELAPGVWRRCLVGTAAVVISVPLALLLCCVWMGEGGHGCRLPLPPPPPGGPARRGCPGCSVATAGSR